MRTNLQPVTWISQNLTDDRRRKAEDNIQQVVIIDDIPRPADFRLSPLVSRFCHFLTNPILFSRVQWLYRP